jgi:alpha-N-arabinofuranosidase
VARTGTAIGIDTSCKNASSGLTCIRSTCIHATRSKCPILPSTAAQPPELPTNASRHYANAVSPRAAERAIEITSSLIDLARCDFDVEVWPNQLDTKPKSTHKPTICFDEWNIWNDKRAPGNTGAEELYDVSDMLGVAVWLNVFVRQSKYVGMATVAQSVNVISPLMTTPRGVIKQTTYWPLLLFSRYMRGKTLAAHVCANAYTGRTFPAWLESTSDTPLLDVSAALSDDGYVNLAVVNISEEKPMSTSMPSTSGVVSVFVVGGKVNGIRDNNTEGSEKVYVRESKWNGHGAFTFESHSFTLLRWKAQGLHVVSNRAGTHSEANGLSSGVHLNGVSESS